MRDDLIQALRYYAAPQTYKNIYVIPDRPCGDFYQDVADEHKTYGQVARMALAKIAAITGEAVDQNLADVEPDHDLMQRLGVDTAKRYQRSPQPGDADYNAEADDFTECCRVLKEYVEGPIVLETLDETCPFCQSPQVKEHTNHREYVCGTHVAACGHWWRSFFDFGQKCVHSRLLKDGDHTWDTEKDAREHFKSLDEKVTGARLSFNDQRELALRCFIRVSEDEPNYVADIPSEYQGLPVIQELSFYKVSE